MYNLRPNKATKAIVAVSGGMDSAVCLHHSIKEFGKENVFAVSILYGQKHDVELDHAHNMCEELGVDYTLIDLRDVFQYDIKGRLALLKGSPKSIVQGETYSELMNKKVRKGEKPISDEYIPNRNSLIANTMCSIAMQIWGNTEFALVLGTHSDDGLKVQGSSIAAYPDCTPEWADSLYTNLYRSTAGLCYVYTPLIYKTKAEVARFGIENGMTKEDFDSTWSCYVGDDKGQCGKCPTCLDRIKALVKSKVYTSPEDIFSKYSLTKKEAENLFITYNT